MSRADRRAGRRRPHVEHLTRDARGAGDTGTDPSGTSACTESASNSYARRPHPVLASSSAARSRTSMCRRKRHCGRPGVRPMPKRVRRGEAGSRRRHSANQAANSRADERARSVSRRPQRSAPPPPRAEARACRAGLAVTRAARRHGRHSQAGRSARGRRRTGPRLAAAPTRPAAVGGPRSQRTPPGRASRTSRRQEHRAALLGGRRGQDGQPRQRAVASTRAGRRVAPDTTRRPDRAGRARIDGRPRWCRAQCGPHPRSEGTAPAAPPRAHEHIFQPTSSQGVGSGALPRVSRRSGSP